MPGAGVDAGRGDRWAFDAWKSHSRPDCYSGAPEHGRQSRPVLMMRRGDRSGTSPLCRLAAALRRWLAAMGSGRSKRGRLSPPAVAGDSADDEAGAEQAPPSNGDEVKAFAATSLQAPEPALCAADQPEPATRAPSGARPVVPSLAEALGRLEAVGGLAKSNKPTRQALSLVKADDPPEAREPEPALPPEAPAKAEPEAGESQRDCEPDIAAGADPSPPASGEPVVSDLAELEPLPVSAREPEPVLDNEGACLTLEPHREGAEPAGHWSEEEPDLAAATESRGESAIEPGAEPEETEPSRGLEVGPEPGPGLAGPEPQPEPQPEPSLEAEAVDAAEIDAVSASEREAAPTPDPQPKPEKPSPRLELEARPELRSEPRPELEPETERELEPDAERAVPPGLEPAPPAIQARDVRDPGGASAPPPKARRYQPRLDRVPPSNRRSPGAERQGAAAEVSTLGADFALLFGAGGWSVELGVLFHRSASMAEEVAVRFAGSEQTLWAIDERAYQVLWAGSASAALADGIVAEALDGGVRWVRTARELHIFSPRADMGGFFSSPRVEAGVENVVICSAALEASVLAALQQVGVEQPLLVSASGVPDGWRCYRGIRPSRTGERSFEGLLAGLNPLAEADIAFAGGVHLGRSSWLVTHPPQIIVTGTGLGRVLIDGVEADFTDQGWRTPASGAVGAHRVEVGGKSKAYQLEAAPTAWEPWPAHRLGTAEICGALVETSGAAIEPPPLDVACWLIGASPGEIAFSDPARASLPPLGFETIWAVPAAAGRRGSALPLQLGPHTEPGRFRCRPSAVQLRWCSVLRQAAIRRPKFSDTASQALWRRYQAVARSGARWRR